VIWEEYKTEFVPDGSLRDIYIKDVDINDWQSFIDFLQSTVATLNYTIDGEAVKLPDCIEDVFLDQKHQHLLSVRLDGVTVNCHFIAPAEIELDLDPKEIDSESKAKVIFRFMSTVGRALKKQVALTPENSKGQAIFTYKPGIGVEYLALNK
jgi:hypothetical protein